MAIYIASNFLGQCYEALHGLIDQVAINIAGNYSVYFGQCYEASYDLIDQVAINIAGSAGQCYEANMILLTKWPSTLLEAVIPQFVDQ